jgi:enamine deaminase RidA (YjgF/YER057c/UK114 family)
MNDAYIEVIKESRPVRTAVAVHEFPKPGFKVLININAVTAE